MNLPSNTEELNKQYSSAWPFPHIVIDGAMGRGLLSYILTLWPKNHDRVLDQEDQLFKAHTYKDETLGGTLASLLRVFNSQEFIIWLEEITGIKGLVMDPFFGGGGLHEIFPGGRLMVHTDFTKHPYTNLDRRINVLIYLNEDWKPEYNGNLELWDIQPDIPGASSVEISPQFNRMVIFNTTTESWHGHNKPLECPRGMSRKSIALYYFTNGENSGPGKITTFIDTEKTTPIRFLKSFVPPILMKAWVWFKTRR